MQAELIYNPRGGPVVIRHALEGVVAYLERSGWNVAWRETKERGEATELARHAAASGARVVIAAGGDGTVNEIANALVHTDTALGVLPVGTTNSWAIQMGIPALNPVSPGAGMARMVAGLEEHLGPHSAASFYRKILLEAARVLTDGNIADVDVGQIAGRYFLMWAGIGLDARVLKSVPAIEKKALGSWAYVFQALGMAGRSSCGEVRLNIDGKLIRADTTLIVVSNIQLYGGMMEIGAKARVNDGKLDVCIFKGDGFFTFVQYGLKVLSHRHLRDPNVEYYQCHRATIEPDCVLPVHLDGEPFTETPVAIETVPKALKAIVSKKAPRDLFNGGL